MASTVMLFSGGLDSLVLLHRVLAQGVGQVHALFVDYGQRACQRELAACEKIIQAHTDGKRVRLHVAVAYMPWLSTHAMLHPEIPYIVFDSEVGRTLPREGNERERAYVVPFRNAVFLSLAMSLAVKERANRIYCAFTYPSDDTPKDKSPAFVKAMQSVLGAGSEPGDPKIDIVAPFGRSGRKDVVREGLEYGVDFSLSWSCYNGFRFPCGQCSPCVSRRKIFHELGEDEGVTYHTRGYVQTIVDRILQRA